MTRRLLLLAVSLLTLVLAGRAAPPAKPVAPGPSAAALLKAEPWQQAPLRPATPAEIDALLRVEKPAPVVDDEVFLRRAWLDLAGRAPPPEEAEAFAASTEPDKRAKVIDRLLASDAFAVRWARYWSDAIATRVDRIMQRLAPIQEEWLAEQLRKNRGWDSIVRDMLTAEAALTDLARKAGEIGPGQPRSGAAFFIATRYYEKTRTEGAIDAAAETARLFLGIQLQCAQCHDDRNGAPWERVQFHQLAAYFGRVGGRPANQKIGKTVALGTWALVYYPQGEYEMTADDDPKAAATVHPAFLTGAGPGPGLGDTERRAALADAVTGPGNFWFAAAFVNRVWKELLGRGFYEPVDDMGPGRKGQRTEVLARLAVHFRATGYDVRGLYRLVMNTRAYQRASGPFGETTGSTATAAKRLPAEVVWAALERVTARAGSPPPADPKPGDRPKPGPGQLFMEEFGFDPSARPERTLPQTLWLMNNPFVHNGTRASGSKVLAAALKAPSDAVAADLLYLHVLGRRATAKERVIVAEHVRTVGKRGEAFEDVVWALVNSPDFLFNR